MVLASEDKKGNKTPHVIVVDADEITPSEERVRPWVVRKPQKFRMGNS